MEIMDLKTRLEGFAKDPKWGFDKVEVRQLTYEIEHPEHPASTILKPVKEKLKELHLKVTF